MQILAQRRHALIRISASSLAKIYAMYVAVKPLERDYQEATMDKASIIDMPKAFSVNELEKIGSGATYILINNNTKQIDYFFDIVSYQMQHKDDFLNWRIEVNKGGEASGYQNKKIAKLYKISGNSNIIRP